MLCHENYTVDFFDSQGTWKGAEELPIEVDIDSERGLARAMNSRACAIRNKLYHRRHKTDLVALVADDTRLGAPILQMTCDLAH
jgi:hypothetical protein